MSENIIRLPANPHRELQLLLPWYVSGRIDPDDAGRLEAHLAVCAECRSELDRERRLDRALAEPADVDTGWAAMRDRLGLDDAPARPVVPRRSVPSWFGWAAAAQLAAAMVIGAVVWLPGDDARYHALGAAAAAPGGNVIVIFRPETSERVFRQTLRDNAARLVDGPTAANAYLLRVANVDRAARLAALRTAPSIVLAEPVDEDRP